MESMSWKVAFDDLDFKVKKKGSQYGSVVRPFFNIVEMNEL